MNALMNITVRVQAAKARAEIKALEAEIKSLRAQLAMAQTAGGGIVSGKGMAALSKFGSRMQWAGRQLVANFTLPLIVAGAVTTKWALDQEAAMVRVQKVYGDAATGTQDFARDVDGLSQAFELLSVKYATQQKDVTNIAADWAAAGAQGAALARGVEATLQVMTLGEMDAADATQALIAIQAQYGTNTKGLIDIVNTLNATENTTGVTFGGLVEGMSRSASAARTAGVDVDHLAAMIASMSPAAGSAAQAGNALKTIFSRLIGPTGEARDVLKEMGINIDDTSWKSLNGAERLERLADAYMHLEGAGKGMISSQAGIVSAVVASRWQINRFDVLMRDLAYHLDDNSKTNGYYTKTLELLSDKAAVAKLAQKELNTVLESNPEMMKRAGIVIQNSFMKIVTRLLPQIIWLANTIADLAQKFSQMDPRLQKFIIGALALLAVLGPPLVLLGSLSVAIAQIGIVLGGVAGAFKWFGGIVFGVVKLMFAPFVAFAKGVSGSMGWAKKSIAGTYAWIAETQAAATAASAAAGAAQGTGYGAAYAATTAAGAAEANVAVGTGLVVRSEMMATFYTAALAAEVGYGRAAAGLAGTSAAAGTAAAGTAIKTGLTGILAFLRVWGIRLITLFSGPWGWAIAAVITILVLFHKQIIEFFKNLIKQAQDGSTGLGKMWTWVVNLFNKGVEAVGKAMQALPAWVRAPIEAVVDIIQKAAMAIYNFFSYINPFAHHSPSLVENVTNGLRVVGQQFDLVADNIEKNMLRGYSALTKFGKATASFMDKYNKGVQDDNKKLIAKHAGKEAAREYQNLANTLDALKKDYADLGAAVAAQQEKVDSLNVTLTNAQNVAKSAQDTYDSLQNVVNGLGDQLDAAKQKLEDFASTPIQGMRAMSDAIFDNQMQEKALQLAMLQLNDVSLQDLQGQLASLQGEIENLKGEQSSLRESGAGSDILGAYQDQIDVLEAQQSAIEATAAPLNDLQQQLEAVQKAGQILDLQNSLQFDPLTRQIDQLANSYSELPFDDIVAGITQQKTIVDSLQESYDAANQSLIDQKVLLDAANAAVDAAQVAVDAEIATLDKLQAAYEAVGDEIQAITDAMDAVVQAASSMDAALQASSDANAGYESPALKNFKGAKGGSYADPGDAFTIGDEGGDIQDWLDDFMKGTGDLFSGIDLFGPIKDKWNSFTGWWSGTVVPGAKDLWQSIADAATDVDWLGPLKNAWNAVSGFFTGIWTKTLPWNDSSLGSSLGGWFGKLSDAWREAWDSIKGALSDAWKKIQPAFDQLRDSIGPLIDSIKDAWDRFSEIREKLQPIAEFINKVVIGVILVAIGVAVAAIIGFITIVANVLSEVIGPVITFISNAITAAMDIFRGLIEFITGGFSGDWGKAWQGILDIFAGIWDAIANVVSSAWSILYGIVKGIVEGVVDFFTWLYDVLVGHSIVPDMVNAIIDWFVKLAGKAIAWVGNLVTGVVDWFVKLPGRIWDAVGNVATFIYEKGSDLVGGLFTGIKDAWVDVSTWVGNIGSKILTAVGGLTKTLYNAGKNLITGLFDGMKDVFENVKKWVSGVGDWISDHKGPKQYDLNLLVPAGGWIMEGLDTGLRQGLPAILGTVESITSSIFNAAANARDSATQSLSTDAARSVTAASGGSGGYGSGSVQAGGGNGANNLSFYGDLSFPNITDPDDADKFLKNLTDLAGSGGNL